MKKLLILKQPEYPKIPAMAPEISLHRPWVEAWSVKKEHLLETLADGTYTLTQLDISINNDEYAAAVNEGFIPNHELTAEESKELSRRASREYQKACIIGCAHCFECKQKINNLLMTTEEVFALLLEAKDLGLKTVKFLGPGELMHNPRLFEILDFLRDNDIKIGIFTKGVSLGDDKWAQKIFSITSKELCEKVASYENVTIMLGMTSADFATEEKRIHAKNVPNIVVVRNRAFENLAAAGMNKDPKNQRLAAICAPVLRDNIDEVLDIYKWGLYRNIPVVVAPTMVSGKGGEMTEIRDEEFKKDLVGLYINIYKYLIQQKIMTLEQIEEEGISPYPGYACNQFIGGLLIRKDGTVQACPGNDSDQFIYHTDVRKKSLKEIWKASMAYRMREKMVREDTLKLTQICPAKTEGAKGPEGQILVNKECGSFKEGFFEEVMAGIKATISKIID
jgi:MoaA/NifB/PqqE/SkfB family radical SAM enzyme